jgi:hypothetical protein
LVPFAPAILGTRAASSYRVVPALRCPAVRRQSRAHARQDGSRTAALKLASRRCALPIEDRSPCSSHTSQLMPAALLCAPPRSRPFRPISPQANAFRSRPRPPTTSLCRARFIPGRKLTRAEPAAAVLTVHRRPASCRRSSTHPRPQIDSW